MIKKTTSLCPICLKPLEAEVYEKDGAIWIKKECPEHGEFDNTYWSNAEIYHKVNKIEAIQQNMENPQVNATEGCPTNCGICGQHGASTVLLANDITTIYKLVP